MVIVPYLRKCLNRVDELRELGVGLKPCGGSPAAPPTGLCQRPGSPRSRRHHSRQLLRSASAKRQQLANSADEMAGDRK